MRIIRSVLKTQDLNVKVVLEDIFADFKNCHEKCRLCFVPVTKRCSRMKITDEIQNKIHSVLQVHLVMDGTGSEFICSECANNLNNAYLFKCKIKEKQNYFEKFSNIKVGDIDDDLLLPFQENYIKTEDELNISTETELTTPIYEVKDEIFDPEHEYSNDVNEGRNVESSEFLKQKQSNPQFVRRDVSRIILRNGSLLQQHKYRKDSKALCCDICGKAFKNRAYIVAHLNTHKKYRTKDFQCYICENYYFDKQYFRQHILNAHNPNLVPCDICGKLLKKHSLKYHSLMHSIVNLIRCDICGKTFKTRANIYAHMVTHKKYRTKDFHCHICGSKYFDKKQLKTHTINAHGKPVPCDICGKVSKSSLLLKRHHRHMHSKMNLFRCDICGKTSRNLYSLALHMDAHKNRNCLLCGKSFRTEEGLKKHELRPHRFPCEVCGKMLRKDALKPHMNRVHLKIKPYECDICGKKFCRTSLSRHVKTHIDLEHRTKDFHCNICETSFFDNGQLRKHMLYRHERPKHLTCSQCGRICWTEEGLKRHELRPHRFPCEVCGKMLRKDALKPHMNRVHLKIKPYECDICGKKFCRTSLSRHVKTHIVWEHRPKDFQCYICETSFFDDKVLQKHIINVHESRKNLKNSSKIDCKTCGKVFQVPSAHFNHMINIHKITPSKEQLQTTVACGVCGKRFFTIQNLKMHTKYLHEEKNYACDYPGCEKKFKTKRYLSKHIFMNHK